MFVYDISIAFDNWLSFALKPVKDAGYLFARTCVSRSAYVMHLIFFLVPLWTAAVESACLILQVAKPRPSLLTFMKSIIGAFDEYNGYPHVNIPKCSL